MERLNVAVIGSRTLWPSDRDIELALPKGTTAIVSGGAAGADTRAAEYGRRRGLPVVTYLPEYDKFGRQAPLVRNKSIVDAADYLVAFWDGTSNGTRYTIRLAEKKGIPVKIISMGKR
jgi:hypothetical protein